MRKIYKYKLGEGAIVVHGHYNIIHTEVQNGAVTVWIEQYLKGSKYSLEFDVIGTGHEIPEAATHIKTWIDAPYVWHLYQVSENEIH